MLPALQHFAEPWMILLTDDPLLRAMQLGLLLCGALVVFTVFFVTRDILLRSRSFPAMLGSILLAAGLPLIGFLIYLLLRPSRTLAQKETDQKVDELLALLKKTPKPRVGDAAKEKAAR
jgi:hypothetical protein